MPQTSASPGKKRLGRFEYALFKALAPEFIHEYQLMTEQEEREASATSLRNQLETFRNGATGEPLFTKRPEDIVYTHHISGNYLSIPVSHHIDIKNLSRLELETTYFGEWETPPAERKRGHCVMAYTEGKIIPQHVMNFCDSGLKLSDLEVIDVAKGLATFLGTVLVVVSR